MLNNMKLSIIVPVYNVAPYLRKCVDSLLAQDYDDYEIILVDDGSTDNSPQICDEYAHVSELEDERVRELEMEKISELARPSIHVIHQKNGGLSAARNAGLKAAKGEYVCFVDSDDYWEEKVLGGLMGQMEREKLDVLRFDYQNVRVADAGHLDAEHIDAMRLEYEVFEPNKTPRYIDRKDEIVDGETYLNTRMGYACYAWQFIIRRSLLMNELENERVSEFETKCLFTPGIHFEDVDWLPRMMLKAKRVNSTQTIVYNYFVRHGSITQTQGNKEKIRKNIEDRLLIIDKYRQYIEQYPTCVWLKNMQSNMIAGVLTTVAQEFYNERKKYISRLKAFKVFPLSIADQGRTYGRKARIINISLRLLVFILHLKKTIS